MMPPRIIHASTEAHQRLYTHAAWLLDTGGADLAADVRSRLVTRHVNPRIRFVVNFGSNQGEKLPSENGGIALVQSGQNKHLAWVVEDFDFVPALSLSPTTEYLNGKQIVSAAGVVSGHAHLHIYQADQEQEVFDHFWKPERFAKPSSYRFFGGHRWYDPEELPENHRLGTGLIIRADSFFGPTALTPGVRYKARFELVHIDDTPLAAETHGMDSARMETMFEVIS